MKHKTTLIIGLIALVLALAGCSSQKTTDTLPVKEITVFKSPDCGCCGIYSQYMKKEGFSPNVRDVTDMQIIKQKHNIPEQLQSCHTTEIGDYFVEGHIPVEVIEKLLSEKPDIAGIALPGMPSGSPGMPGKKTESWMIYAVNKNGSYEEFMTI